MTTLVCIDTQAGTLRRYERGVVNPMSRKPICTGFARYEPWQALPTTERVMAAGDIEAFRTAAPVTAPGQSAA